MFKSLLIGVIVLGVGIGAAFGAGTVYGRSIAPQGAGNNVASGTNPAAASGAGGPGAFSMGQGALAGRPAAAGTIETVTENGFTVKTGGSTMTVKIDDKTVIRKTVTATPQDLKPGETVMVMGSAGSDGTVSATSISLGEVTVRVGQSGDAQGGTPSGQGSGGGRQGQGGARQGSGQ